MSLLLRVFWVCVVCGLKHLGINTLQGLPSDWKSCSISIFLSLGAGWWDHAWIVGRVSSNNICCVCVWNIWIDVKLLPGHIQSRGHAAVTQTHANEAMRDSGSTVWSTVCTCNFSTGLSFSPFQNAELWMYLFNRGFISPFLFTSWTSREVRRRGLFIIYN